MAFLSDVFGDSRGYQGDRFCGARQCLNGSDIPQRASERGITQRFNKKHLPLWGAILTFGRGGEKGSFRHRLVDMNIPCRYTAVLGPFLTPLLIAAIWLMMSFIRSRFSRLRYGLGLALAIGQFCLSAAADEKPPDIKVQYSPIRTGAGGMYTYVPEKWSIVGIEAVNRADEPRELMSSSYFNGAPSLQYARQWWMPGRSRLKTWLPVLCPTIPKETNYYTLNSLLLDRTRTGDVLFTENSGERLHTDQLPVHRELPITAMIDTLERRGDFDTEAAFELVVAARVSQRRTRRVTKFGDRQFAPDDVSLEGVDQLVIADSRVLDDPAGVAAIRRWVHRGGRLWVMLDRVDPLVVELLVGDTFACQVVDRVSLTTVRIEPVAKMGAAEAIEIDYEQPVEMVRVVVAEAEVVYTVNGSPAAFWKSYGAGTVLVTTLAPPGWMRQKSSGDTLARVEGEAGAGQQDNDAGAQFQSAYETLPPMSDLAMTFFQARPPPAPLATALELQSSEYVGYTIPPRWIIVGLLAGFATAILGLGIWLWRKGSLEHLGWLAPGLAVVVAAGLLVIGGLNRHSIPSTAAVVALVEAIPGTDDVQSQGVVTFYNPESEPWVIEATLGGRMMPDTTGMEGTTHRMVFTDLGRWHWENLTLDGGRQRSARFTASGTLGERLEARATFGPEGLTGRLSAGGMSGFADALIATHEGRLGVEMHGDGTFWASADAVFAPGQYLGAGLLSDEQNRRRRTYERVLPGLFAADSSGPRLLMWATQWNSGYEFDAGRRRLGGALAAVPLILERPAVKTGVRIPAPLLSYRNTAQPDGTPSSPMWDYRKQEWAERSAPSSSWLKVRLPAALLPLELTRGRVLIQVSGPVGLVEILGLRATAGGDRKEVVSIRKWIDPEGTLTVDVSDRDLLQLEPDGTLILGLAAGDPARPELTAPEGEFGKRSVWRIARFSLELTGIVSEPSPAGSTSTALDEVHQ